MYYYWCLVPRFAIMINTTRTIYSINIRNYAITQLQTATIISAYYYDSSMYHLYDHSIVVYKIAE